MNNILERIKPYMERRETYVVCVLVLLIITVPIYMWREHDMQVLASDVMTLSLQKQKIQDEANAKKLEMDTKVHDALAPLLSRLPYEADVKALEAYFRQYDMRSLESIKILEPEVYEKGLLDAYQVHVVYTMDEAKLPAFISLIDGSTTTSPRNDPFMMVLDHIDVTRVSGNKLHVEARILVMARAITSQVLEEKGNLVREKYGIVLETNSGIFGRYNQALDKEKAGDLRGAYQVYQEMLQ